MQFTYQAKLERDLKRWQDEGLISNAAMQQMLQDAASRKSSWSFANVVAILGIISLCFAAMTFVAANWNEMSRTTRVVLLLAGLWISYGIACLFKARGNDWLSHGFVLLGCGVFGASIMLIGQIYHMQGEATDAVFLWIIGTLVAALVLQAVPALALAGLLAVVWHGMLVWDDMGLKTMPYNLWFLPLIGIIGAGAYWLRSRWTAHVVTIGVFFWMFTAVVTFSERNDDPSLIFVAFLSVMLAIGVLLYLRENRSLLMGFDAPLIGYTVFAVGAALWLYSTGELYNNSKSPIELVSGIGLVAIWVLVALGIGLVFLARQKQSKQTYDLFFLTLWMIISAVLMTWPDLNRIPFIETAFALAFAVWTIRMGWRQELPTVTRLGYLGFASIMLTAYFSAAGKLLGTSLFYLVTGFLMVVGALFVPKMLRAKTIKSEAV